MRLALLIAAVVMIIGCAAVIIVGSTRETVSPSAAQAPGAQPHGTISWRDRQPVPAEEPAGEVKLGKIRRSCYDQEQADHAAKIREIGGDPNKAIDKLEVAGTYETGIYEKCMLAAMTSPEAQHAIAALPPAEREKWNSAIPTLKVKLAEIDRLARFRVLYNKATATPAIMTPAEISEITRIRAEGREPKIGMTEWEVPASAWYDSWDVHETTTAAGVTKQYVYHGDKRSHSYVQDTYPYFKDGFLIAIQR